MAEWEKQEIELDKNGIYCSFGTYMATSIFKTTSNIQSRKFKFIFSKRILGK